ncbi:MAG: hypothetical protein OSA48_11575 [Akkermansiaceae bacterium]|jgi:hypothetical protein|nr:hypothetical protein [Akkermansiaceae bacterium]
MADKKKTEVPEEPVKKKGVIMRNMMMLALLALAVIGGLTYLTFDPQSLVDIEGYNKSKPMLPPLGRDVGAVLAAAHKGQKPAKISEEEINDYIQRTLKLEQGGAFAGHVELKGVWVRLEDGVAEVIIERELMAKRRHTIAFRFRVEQTEGPDGQVLTQLDPLGGRFGRTKVPEGYLHLVMGSFNSLIRAYGGELDVLKKMVQGMTRVTIADGELVLTPPDA